MAYEQSQMLRHTPKQHRGQRRVDHIIRSAEALFAEVGFANATTNAIAARAGISIGSLYQFFASKEQILEAMASRYLDQMRFALSKGFEATDGLPLDDFLTYMLETIVKLQEQRPYFLQCLSASRPSPVLNHAVDELSRAIEGQVVDMLERVTVETDRKMIELRARICVGAMSALIPVALYSKGKERARNIQEIKLVMIRYLEPMLKVKGVV